MYTSAAFIESKTPMDNVIKQAKAPLHFINKENLIAENSAGKPGLAFPIPAVNRYRKFRNKKANQKQHHGKMFNEEYRIFAKFLVL